VGQALPQRADVLFAIPSQSENVCVKDEALKVVVRGFLGHRYLLPFVKTPCFWDQCEGVEFGVLLLRTYHSPQRFLDKGHGVLGKTREVSPP